MPTQQLFFALLPLLRASNVRGGSFVTTTSTYYGGAVIAAAQQQARRRQAGRPKSSTLFAKDASPGVNAAFVPQSGQEGDDGALHPLPPTSAIAGVVFDMDGTITKHCIDFAEMRRRIYEIADDDFDTGHDGGCVLELAEKMSPSGQRRANVVFGDVERRAVEEMQFMDGLADLCHFLDDQNIRRAVLTRNVMTGVEAMHERLLDWEGVDNFHPAVSRDSTCDRGVAIPAKPAPDAILHICAVWGCQPSEVLMVGDSPADDMVAAYHAGCGGRVLLAEGGQVRDNDSGGGGPRDEEEILARTPDVTVSSLLQLRDLLQVC